MKHKARAIREAGAPQVARPKDRRTRGALARFSPQKGKALVGMGFLPPPSLPADGMRHAVGHAVGHPLIDPSMPTQSLI
jgi:hypothetical protein